MPLRYPCAAPGKKGAAPFIWETRGLVPNYMLAFYESL